MIDAAEVSKTVSAYGFAIDREKLASALRKLADDVESGAVLPQQCMTYSLAESDDFAFGGMMLRVKFAPKKE